MTYRIQIYIIREGWREWDKCTRIIRCEKDSLEFIDKKGNKIIVSGLPYLIAEENDN
jgi:hypothetical protein